MHVSCIQLLIQIRKEKYSRNNRILIRPWNPYSLIKYTYKNHVSIIYHILSRCIKKFQLELTSILY